MRSRKAVESWATENWSRHALFCLTGPGGDNVLQEALRGVSHCPLSSSQPSHWTHLGHPTHPCWRLGVDDPSPPPASPTSPPKSPPNPNSVREGGSRLESRRGPRNPSAHGDSAFLRESIMSERKIKRAILIDSSLFALFQMSPDSSCNARRRAHPLQANLVRPRPPHPWLSHLTRTAHAIHSLLSRIGHQSNCWPCPETRFSNRFAYNHPLAQLWQKPNY